MQAELETLPITEDELEELIHLNIFDNLAVSIYRALVFKNKQQISSVLITETCLFILLLILVMPVTLMTMRSLELLPESSTGINQLLVTLVSLIFVFVIISNFYLWHQGKKLKSLAKLWQEIDKYNQVVQTLNLMSQIQSVASKNETREEAITALKITRTSLINGLKIEEIMRKHQEFINRPYELLTSLENNLANLMTFEVSNQTDEYGHLLNDALKIGMSVHKEVNKLKS